MSGPSCTRRHRVPVPGGAGTGWGRSSGWAASQTAYRRERVAVMRARRLTAAASVAALAVLSLAARTVRAGRRRVRR